MTKTKSPDPIELLTPAEAGQRLLEHATLLAVRSHGHEGLLPVKDGRRPMFKIHDVDAYMQRVLERRPAA